MVVKAVLDVLFTNLQVSPDCSGTVYVMYGYDTSVAEAALRLSSVRPLQVVTVCWADIDSDSLTVCNHEKIARWLIRGNKQTMKNLLSEKLFILEGYQSGEVKVEDAPPTHLRRKCLQDHLSSGQWALASSLRMVGVGQQEVYT